MLRWRDDPSGISLGPHSVLFLPHPAPSSLQAPAHWEVQKPPHAPSFLLVPNKGPEGEKSLEPEEGWPSRRSEASGPSETP